MARKQELKDVDWIAKEGGLTAAQRDEFSDYLHDCKVSGDRGTKNDRGDFTREEMRQKLDEFKSHRGIA